MNKMLSLLAAALAVGCASPPPHDPASPATVAPSMTWISALDRGSPLVGKIWQPAAGRMVDEQAVFAELGRADFVLLGEQHENLDHHRLQAAAVAAVVRAGRKPTITLEMLDPDDDEVIARYRATAHPDAAALGALLAWDKRGWSPWTAYQPIAATAFEANLPFVSANLPSKVVRAVAHGGVAALSPEEVTRLGLDVPFAPELEASLEEELRASHCGKLPEAMVGSMALAQRARDGQMAARMLAPGTPAVLIAGGGHARTDRGVPLRLRAARPGAKVVSVGFMEVDARESDPKAYASRYGVSTLPFDFVWFTPRANDDDPCAGFTMGSHAPPSASPPAGK